MPVQKLSRVVLLAIAALCMTSLLFSLVLSRGPRPMPQVSNAPSDFPGATSDQPKVEAERASDTAEQQDALGMASNPESLPTMRATTTTTKTTIIVPAAELLPVAESAPLVLKKAAVPAAAAQLSQSPLLRKIRDGAPPFDAATPTCDIAAYPMPSIESGLPWVHDAFAVDAVLTKKRKNNNLPSKIRRFCICKVWQQGMQRKPICGVCVLKHTSWLPWVASCAPIRGTTSGP